ncbi:HEAT repeat-containing protein 3 isoform X2 [Xenopus laevis]|uniref:HEAT repeat-containing protein 3 isoform X2 n=1 Tax=Xenopus laevis TaxID=8355 RepID=A0A8J0V0Y6_XENLA|nr:HEAT repeat-containing protein 3 isoform X2 [Xenopus laevis]
MGKSRARRFKPGVFDPTLPVRQSNGLGEQENSETPSLQAEELLQKLQSPSPEVREFACASISKLVQQKKVIPSFLQRDAVRCLGPLLLDPCLTVRETAAGALRNLSTCGGFDVCDDMVSRDVMTPLVALLRECTTGLDVNMESAMKSKDVAKNYVEDIANQALNVLWNVCESSSKALCVFNKENCVDIVLQCLSKFQTNTDMAISAAYCLQTVTEDNQDLLNSIDDASLQMLEPVMLASATNMDIWLLQTVVAGSVWNLRERIAASVQADSITAILRIIAEVLSVDAGQYILQMKEVGTKQLSAATVEHESEEATAILDPSVSEEDEMMDGFSKQKKITDISDLIPAANYEIRQATSLLVAQKTALEMVVNMCCSDDPSDDEWEELSSSDESDLGLEKSLNDGGGQLLSPLCLSDEVHTALLNHFIPKKVFEKTRFPNSCAVKVCQEDPAWKPLIPKLYTVQYRALTCLNNILSVFDMESLGGASALQELAQHLSEIVFTQSDVLNQDEFLEAASSAVRAVLQIMASKGIPQRNGQSTLICSCTDMHIIGFVPTNAGAFSHTDVMPVSSETSRRV